MFRTQVQRNLCFYFYFIFLAYVSPRIYINVCDSAMKNFYCGVSREGL